jgi:hypothetical protein
MGLSTCLTEMDRISSEVRKENEMEETSVCREWAMSIMPFDQWYYAILKRCRVNEATLCSTARSWDLWVYGELIDAAELFSGWT